MIIGVGNTNSRGYMRWDSEFSGPSGHPCLSPTLLFITLGRAFSGQSFIAPWKTWGDSGLIRAFSCTFYSPSSFGSARTVQPVAFRRWTTKFAGVHFELVWRVRVIETRMEKMATFPHVITKPTHISTLQLELFRTKIEDNPLQGSEDVTAHHVTP